MFADQTLWQMLVRGGYTMLVLAGCSVLMLAVVIERFWVFSRYTKAMGEAAKRIARDARTDPAAIARGVERASRRLGRRLPILGTLGAVAPFIGLFGTVLGVMRAFHDLALAGTGNPSVVSAGIAEALIATAAGLFVAVPSVIFYNYFTHRAETLDAELEDAVLSHPGPGS